MIDIKETTIDHKTRQSKNLTPNDFCVLTLMAYYTVDFNKPIQVNILEMAKFLCMEEREVMRSLDYLEAKGLLRNAKFTHN